ncbi:hypothetical protein D0C36_20635 [Mucilaginibacter conchicola]|uniref:DUF1471 domain-containing protein n=2 Tax=Mucilaginibacter conchicola TaxID=2303333 RepID=A0A372NSK5_9SPHI|nr:hypothetical protein D0C36_20635 [Mucilaginibacter conchicola]
MGDQLPASTQVDVYYAEKDVAKKYKVIGHIYTSTAVNANKVKEAILTKAKAVGADGVIILGIKTTGGGNEVETVQQADAIKYTKE